MTNGDVSGALHSIFIGPVAPSRDELEERLVREGLEPRWWENDAGARFEWHAHDFTKILYCAAGSIIFHLRDGDVTLNPGDRLELDPETEHSATMGPTGAICVEAFDDL